MGSPDYIGLKNKIKWLTKAVEDGDYYSQFLLKELKRIYGLKPENTQ